MCWNNIDAGWNFDNKGSKTIDEQAIEQRAIKRKIKCEEIHTLKAKALADLCVSPKEGEQWRIITEKQFNAYAFIKYLLEREQIDELYISIYRISEPIVESLIDLIKRGRIKNANFILSNFFLTTVKSEKWIHKLKEFCDDNNAKAAFVHNHTKIAIAKTSKGKCFVFEGSGNMSDNARIEQYIFEQNEIVYNFHKQWMDEVIRKYKK